MKSPSISVENLDAIEKHIRRRIEELDENYKRERASLEEELAHLEITKKSMVDLLIKYSSEHVGRSDLLTEEMSPALRDSKTSGDMPWGRRASGVDQVIYVIREAGAGGLGRLEILDRIATISGTKPELNSVTTWIYRAKKRGEIRNRRRKWYATSSAK